MKLLRTALIVAVTGALSSAALAEAHAEKAAALIAAIEANGCVISEANAEAVLTASGLAPEDAQAVMDQIGEAGEAADATVKLMRNEDGTTSLISPNCPAQ